MEREEVYQFEYGENVDGIRKELEQKKEKKPVLAGYMILGFFILFAGFEVAYQRFWHEAVVFSQIWWMWHVPALILTVLFPVEFWIVFKIKCRKRIKKLEQELLEKQKNHMICIFQTEYFQIQTNVKEDKILYSKLQKVVEDDYLFRITGENGEIVFEKAYLSYEEINQLRSVLQEKGSAVYRCEVNFIEKDEIHMTLPYREKSEEEKRQLWKIQIYREQKRKNERTEAKDYGRFTLMFVTIIAICANIPINSSTTVIIVIFLLYLSLWGLYEVCIRSSHKKNHMQIDFTEQNWSIVFGKTNIHGTGKQIDYIIEVENFFLIKNKNKTAEHLIGKRFFSEQEAMQLRMFFKKYFPECYRYEEVPNYAEKNPKWKVFIKRIILFFIFLVLAFCINRLFRKPEPKPPVMDNFETHWQQLIDEQNEERRKKITEGINQDGTYVEIVSDLADLNLTSYRLNRYDCFCTNITNGVSHFVIQNGTLMGASTNKNGELGLGHCEPDYDARGYLRYEEIAENVRHIAIGDSFMVYVTDDNQLWGTGQLPGIGQCLTPTFLMEDVTYVSCGSSNILLMKEDSTAWIVGNLGEGINYPEYTQVFDHVKFVSADGNTAAVIRQDDTLWMWGDNQYGQCCISTDTLDSTQIPEPRQVLDDVKVVWVGDLKFNSTLTELKEPQQEMDTPVNRTYIQKNDSTLYVCGENISDDGKRTFMPLKVVEE